MRYREGAEPDARYPHGELMHEMLTLSVIMSLFVGTILLWLGWRGRSLWLSVWSAGLIGCSTVYLAGVASGWI